MLSTLMRNSKNSGRSRENASGVRHLRKRILNLPSEFHVKHGASPALSDNEVNAFICKRKRRSMCRFIFVSVKQGGTAGYPVPIGIGLPAFFVLAMSRAQTKWSALFKLA